MGKRISQLVFFLCVCFFSINQLAQAPTDAAQDDSANATIGQQQEEVETDTDSDTPGADASGQDVAQVDEEDTDAAGRFIPTEQLSQDLGASFPVDI